MDISVQKASTWQVQIAKTSSAEHATSANNSEQQIQQNMLKTD